MGIQYVIGDVREPVERPALIANICSDTGLFGVSAVCCNIVWGRYPLAKMVYKEKGRAGLLYLGSIHIATVDIGQECDVIIINLVAATWKHRRGDVLDPDALDECLDRLYCIADGLGHGQTPMGVHFPRRGGVWEHKWGVVEPLILRNLCDNQVPVFVYDQEGKNAIR